MQTPSKYSNTTHLNTHPVCEPYSVIEMKNNLNIKNYYKELQSK